MTVHPCVGVFAFLLAGQPGDRPPPKPEVELRVFPSITTVDIADGNLITATVIIRNADETLWCPEVEWDWDGEARSTRESDCAPFEESEVGERTRWTRTRQHRFWGRRIVNIVVRLLKGGKVIRRVEAQVPIK